MLFEKLKIFYKLTRPIAAIPFLFCFLFGALDSSISIGMTLLTSFIFLFLIFGPLHIINHYSDTKVDKRAKYTKDLDLTRQPFLTGEMTKTNGIRLSIILLIFGLAGTYFINLYLFVFFVLIIFFGTIYSVILRAKSIPILDVIFNSTGGAASYLAALYLGEGNFGSHVFSALWLFFLIASTYLLTLIVDYEQDKKSKIKTTAVFLGKRFTVRLSGILFIISLIFYSLILIFYNVTWVYWILLLFWIITFMGRIRYILFPEKINSRAVYGSMKRAVIYSTIIIALILIAIALRGTYV